MPACVCVCVPQATISYLAVEQYVLIVQARDFPPNATATQYSTANIIISVTHVNHPPSLPTPPVAYVPEFSPVGTLVGSPIVGSDVDTACCGDTIVYSLTTYTALFGINGTSGQVTLLQVLWSQSVCACCARVRVLVRCVFVRVRSSLPPCVCAEWVVVRHSIFVRRWCDGDGLRWPLCLRPSRGECAVREHSPHTAALHIHSA